MDSEMLSSIKIFSIYTLFHHFSGKILIYHITQTHSLIPHTKNLQMPKHMNTSEGFGGVLFIF